MSDKNDEFYPKGFHAQVVSDWQKAKAEVERQEPLAAEEIKALTEKVMRLHSHVQGQVGYSAVTVHQLTDEVNSWLANIGDLKVDRQMVYEALGQMDGDGCAGSTYSYGIRTWFLYAEHQCEPTHIINIQPVIDSTDEFDQVGICKFCGNIWVHDRLAAISGFERWVCRPEGQLHGRFTYPTDTATRPV